MIGKYVIVRSNMAGVFGGFLKEKHGNEVILTNCRQFYSWSGALNVLDMAVNGVTKPHKCTYTIEIDEIWILDVCEIAPCTDKAIKILREVKAWTI